jgi:triphosphoribosyl-dephospho-CoA synthetase
MGCSRVSALRKLAAALAKGAAMELYLTPKPGLVDLEGTGSHPDLSLAIMERSIELVSQYLDDMVTSLLNSEPFSCQRDIAIRIEQRLLRELRTNTHKGYVFLSGMLLIACWHAPALNERSVRGTLSSLAESHFKGKAPHATNGGKAREKYQTGGIIAEAIGGFPSVFEGALPAYRVSMRCEPCVMRASFAMLARLMQVVDDTTALHRAGPAGLARLKQDGSKLMRRIDEGGYIAFLRELNRSYVRTNLTMGGVADLLGVSYGYLIFNGGLSEKAFAATAGYIEIPAAS